MPTQTDLDNFHADIKRDDVGGLDHPFLKDNHIYLHATESKNLNSILATGFDPKYCENVFKFCYFAKSFHIAKGYVRNKTQPQVIIAVDLSYLFDPDNPKKFLDENTGHIDEINHEVKLYNRVDQGHIIGHITI